MGGAEKVIERLVLGLRTRGFEAEAACLLPLPAAGGVAALLAAAGVPVRSFCERSKAGGGTRALVRLARHIAARRPALVSSFLFHANMLARLARLFARPRPRLVVSLRIAEPGRPWRLALERLSAGLADRVVCVSESVRRAASLAPPRAIVIANGVPIPPRAAALAPGAPWISVGRLHSQKGHDILIDAWRLLGPGAPRLRIAGAGPLESELRARAAGLPVEFLGERADVPALLEGSGGFVLASRDEGLSNAVLEAMAAGLPVVATEAGGNAEAVGAAGILVRPAGDAAVLAAAVRDLASDPDRARALGAAARARAERVFSVERMVADYAALYESLLG